MMKTPLMRAPLERKSSIIKEDAASGFDKACRASAEKLTKASPFGNLLENVRKFASERSLWDDDMQRDLPKKWERHGNMIVFPHNSFAHNNWRLLGRELWKLVAESLKVERIGRKRIIADDLDRTPHIDLMYGDNGWVEHVDERNIRYVYDASKRVFNNTRNKEMQRIAQWDCHGEIIVDMYGGLGYYTFPFVVSCHAKHVYTIDWDTDMCEVLQKTAEANGVSEIVTVIEGDCRRKAPTLIADRVYLGLIPTCRAHWLTACKALKAEGGVLHIQEVLDISRQSVPRKEIPHRKLLKLPSVNEETSITNEPETPSTPTTSSTDVLPAVSEESGEQPADASDAPVKRKFSRSASIVEEMENRTFPDPSVYKEYEEGGWTKLDAVYKDFAMDCATSCTRFLNNIHLSDTMYCVTILNLTKYDTNSPRSSHVVIDLLCSMQDAPINTLAARLLNTNLSHI